MTEILLYIVQRSLLTEIVILSVLTIVIALSVYLIFWQNRKGKELAFELSQLDKLKKTNIEYDFILKAMHLSTWHLDPKTRAITFDNDYREQTGDWSLMMDGTVIEDGHNILDSRDAQRIMDNLGKICDGKIDDYHEEYRIGIPHTKKFYWEESYATVAERDIDGKPLSIVGTSMRIDDRKTMEEALVEARNKAEESDRLKSAFLANISHEIRTPLNAIIGFTSVISDVTDATERQTLLDLIHENTQKLLRIIDDVVSISKIESGKDELVMMNFDVPQLLNELADQWRRQLKESLTLETKYALDQLSITTDRNRLAEIIKPLLSNASKFTAAGTITLAFEAPKDGRLLIKVSDTGKGIAPKNCERVFERFFKVDEFIPGAGLGLSLSRTMAFSLGGTVSVESELGKGSTFTVTIPIQ